jgi:hypothetical protein
VAVFKLFVLPLLFTLLSTTAQDIEKAFLQNNPKTLYLLFSSESGINISLPEPISFSDQLSRQQAYFLFKKVFSSYTTFEFFSESEVPPDLEEKSFIFRARWSFRDNKNNNQHVLHIFFFLLNETESEDRASPSLSGREGGNPKNVWKIIEIKAEKI